jgi:hypothetical protein
LVLRSYRDKKVVGNVLTFFVRRFSYRPGSAVYRFIVHRPSVVVRRTPEFPFCPVCTGHKLKAVSTFWFWVHICYFLAPDKIRRINTVCLKSVVLYRTRSKGY